MKDKARIRQRKRAFLVPQRHLQPARHPVKAEAAPAAQPQSDAANPVRTAVKDEGPHPATEAGLSRAATSTERARLIGPGSLAASGRAARPVSAY
ncbi:hypothetical protein GCM10023084_63600 [Streptomyces lacrimifluminis]|uniref:Uncharacterized protein n=1 Tax=Streptomyces lacrimifluminis TaxID=1500077 RepID=A0A917P308_9ACTN|nr:hypothetical protein GCM10012282_63250 [Streptomyces lacrimifluminis]